MKNGEGKGGKSIGEGKCHNGRTDSGIVKIKLEFWTQNSQLYFLKVEFD